MIPVRNLNWDGCLNIRDLGGLPTADGGATRFGAIVRADSIRQLSDAGWEALVDYGVSRIVDLRFDSELAADPPQELPVELVHVSVLPDADSNHWTEIDALGDAAPDAATATSGVYLEFLVRFGASFARAVEAVAAAPEGAVLIHCLGGKDRTGLVSALLLRLAEVPIAEVAADYALSAERLITWSSPWIQGAENEEGRRRRTRISQTPASAMNAVLEELERRHGSVCGYLSIAGLEEVTAQRIRERLQE
ncbi:MAG TPA: tyrosine-protein phosphatase [Actinomycetota bacterium]|nr:tyrosine-protein phosphatase [Actinomycetota bacterium]